MAEIIGKKIIELQLVESTNNYAMSNAAKHNYDEGTVVVAKSQSAGRGQRNNTWESADGLNLLLSIVLKPDYLPVQNQFMLSKVAALAVSDLVALYAGNVSVKWPNDIYVGDKKIAGILIDNSIMGSTLGLSVTGIGLNINQTAFSSVLPNPTSLAMVLGQELNVHDAMLQLLDLFEIWYSLLRKGQFGLIHEKYLSRLYMLEQEREYRDTNGEFRGCILGVDEIGRLEIADSDGQRRVYHFKEVELLPVR